MGREAERAQKMQGSFWNRRKTTRPGGRRAQTMLRQPLEQTKRLQPSAAARGLVRRGLPHLFELVELAHFGPEDVNDHVAGVDQNPIGGLAAFDPRCHPGLVLQAVNEVLAERRDVAGGPARGDDGSRAG